ncbi:MAG: glycosyltransferase family 4 protein [Sandaracinus sp.]|nr:glycosyltransferase family 4 protein [Sandaracinus sp.]MCB9634253.1 glycosyltransferase family 4 protein [Sandaracinus sp.]
MRIAYVVNRYPAVSHTFIRREIEGLEAHGVEVVRVSARDVPLEEMPDPRDRAERDKTHVLLSQGPRGLLPALERTVRARPAAFARALDLTRRIGVGSASGLGKNLAYLAEACVVREICDAERIDHVHAHFGTNPAAVAMLCRELGGPPFSFTVHGPEEFDRPDALRLTEKIARSAFVVGVSSFGRSQLFRWARFEDWSKVRVVRCGVDPSFLAGEPTPPSQAPRFVCVGRICEQKGQLLLVEAAEMLARKGHAFELVLVGDGPMRAEVEQSIASRGLSDRVRITGWATGAEVRRHLEDARAMLLPSFAEGLPVVIMEALALGRPVLTTYIAGIPELVRHENEGWLFPAGSPAATADAMEACLEAPHARLVEMGLSGRRRVAEMHDAHRNAGELLAHVERGLSMPGTPPRM